MITTTDTWGFVLCLARVSPLMSSVGIQVFSRIPVIVRTIFLLVFSALLLSNVRSVEIPTTLVGIFSSIASELIFGMVFVFSLKIIYGAVDFVGRTLDTHMGFGAVNVINPFSKEQSSLIGSILTFAFTLVIIISGVHIELLKLLAISVEIIPIGKVDVTYDPNVFIVHMSGMFIFILVLFSPIISALFILDLIIGMVAKTMPQMNVYFVTLPLKILVGILLLAIVIRSSGAGLSHAAIQSIHFLTSL